ncbi:MAG TPA: 7-cyano-7-deazaguanine synthase QueC [Longimicrobium sp.]|nr:7-cyano-7-deazaguanine synthase QueC [Longimicrobium sp.]
MSTRFSRPCVVLLSGGLDSTTVLAIARAQGFDPHCLTFDYGQRHAVEIEAARRVAAHFGVRDHRIARIDLRIFGGSALTDDIAVPTAGSVSEIKDEIPATYVPARNLIFLSYAVAMAETIGAGDVFIGVNEVDYSGYPDCRAEFVRSYQDTANLATKAAVEGRRLAIHAPLQHMDKGEIVRRGMELGVDYSVTLTCYQPSAWGEACGVCHSCLLRMEGFARNGITDPAPYRAAVEAA